MNKLGQSNLEEEQVPCLYSLIRDRLQKALSQELFPFSLIATLNLRMKQSVLQVGGLPCVFCHLLCQRGRGGRSACESQTRFRKLRTEASLTSSSCSSDRSDWSDIGYGREASVYRPGCLAVHHLGLQMQKHWLTVGGCLWRPARSGESKQKWNDRVNQDKNHQTAHIKPPQKRCN